MRHGGDDADLRIGPAHAFDAGALAEPRALAVGGDEEARFDRLAAAELHGDAEGVGREVGDALGRENLDGGLLGHGGGEHAPQARHARP